MFLAKLCGVLETDIDGLHVALVKIPGMTITIGRYPQYDLIRNDIYYSLSLHQDKQRYLLSAYYYDFELFRKYLPHDKSKNMFLSSLVKPIVKVKSARN
jgi:hypothetical protein